MQIVDEFDLLDAGGTKAREDVQAALTEIRAAIHALVWPAGSDRFTIHPESGKKSGEGNGVRPIRDAFVLQLEALGWQSEQPFPVSTPPELANFGKMDASKNVGSKPFLVEWETGNISSSHRAMNKIGLALAEGAVTAGVLIVPSKPFARYLTDRIGNIWELRPYFPLWQAIQADAGYLGVIVVQHDDESFDVERIRKGTDGRALT